MSCKNCNRKMPTYSAAKLRFTYPGCFRTAEASTPPLPLFLCVSEVLGSSVSTGAEALGRQSFAGECVPSQDSFHRRQQLAFSVTFQDESMSPVVQSGCDHFGIVVQRQEQDFYPGSLPSQEGCHLESADSRQPKIEQHQVMLPPVRLCDGLTSIAGFSCDLESLR